MKKMQFFMVLLLTAMVSVFFSSCRPDSPDDPTQLIKGKWEVTRMDYEAEESGCQFFDKEEWVWEFDGEELTMYENDRYNGAYRYEVEENKLYTEYATYYMAKYFKITTLNDTKLVLDVSYEYQGEKAKYSFVFKRM